MKHIHITVEDDQYERAKEAKGDRTWREMILDAAGAANE